MSTSYGWEGKGRYGSLMNAGCAGKTMRSLENACHTECLRGVITTRHYTNPSLPLPLHLFHHHTRDAYVFNGFLSWYNVVLTPWIHSIVKYRQLVLQLYFCGVSNQPFHA